MKNKIFIGFGTLLVYAMIIAGACLFLMPQQAAAQRMVNHYTGKYYPLYSVTSDGRYPPQGVATVPHMSEYDGSHLLPIKSASSATGVIHSLAVTPMFKVQSGGDIFAAVYGVVKGVQLVDTSSSDARVITTNDSILVTYAPALVKKLNVNSVGTASTVEFYNDETLPCDSGFVARYDTTAMGTTDIDHTFCQAICVKTAGTAAASITVFSRISP